MDLDKYLFTLSNILERIDEYGLYCHYLGFDPELSKPYNSPIRERDDHPSFSFFEAYDGMECEYLWKDSALDISGTIVQLVMYMYDLSFSDALKKIDSDFKLGFTNGTFSAERKVLKVKRPVKSPVTIQISSKYDFSKKGLGFWESFSISKKTLQHFNVTEISSAIVNGKPVYYKEPTFAYRISDKYKIYCPGTPEYKFMNNYPNTFVEGFAQLPKKSETLIITKSLKDVMVLYELGYESISPKSETTQITEEYFKWIDANYSFVIVLFDNDMKHNGHKYPYNLKYIPLESNCKDISDYVKMYGKEKGLWLMKQLLK